MAEPMTPEQAAEALADQTMLRSLDVGPRGITLDLAPPHDLVLSMVETAKRVLGDAPNYTETPVTLTVSASGEVEHYAFTIQRVGNLTPHQAREKAEAEAEELRAERDRLRHALERAALSVEHDYDSSACQERDAYQESLRPCQQRPAEHAEDCPACDVQAALSSPSGEQGEQP